MRFDGGTVLAAGCTPRSQSIDDDDDDDDDDDGARAAALGTGTGTGARNDEIESSPASVPVDGSVIGSFVRSFVGIVRDDGFDAVRWFKRTNVAFAFVG